MTHLTLRLAWHQNGWDGTACKNPEDNTYCIGNQSYPGDRIKELRQLELQEVNGEKCFICKKIDGALPCAYSNNTFSKEHSVCRETPPSFFNGGADPMDIDVAPSTAFIWPYEQMYRDEVKAIGTGRQYDYNKRLEYSENFFNELKNNESLVFYYANKSNPFSTDDNQKYVLIGVSRIKEKGNTLYYENATDKIKELYANGFIWQRGISSHYPEQGFKLPLQKYQDNPAVIDRILIVPEQTSNFKYAARHITDDDALLLVEQLLESVKYLKEIKDTEEDWAIREKWLISLMNELWIKRGAYPGLPSFLDASDMHGLLPFYKTNAEQNQSKEAFKSIFGFLDGTNNDTIFDIDSSILDDYKSHWNNHYDKSTKELIKCFSRIELSKEQWNRILSADKEEFSIISSIENIITNPYLIAQEYIGTTEGDIISFNKIDHGMIPSPELGLEPLFKKGSLERLKSLTVATLKRENKHTFIEINEVLQNVNRKLSYLPEWKSYEFNKNYILNNPDFFKDSLFVKTLKESIYLYLKEVWLNEREIEKTINDLIDRPEIKIIKPITEQKWYNYLYDSESQLAINASEMYEEAIQGQVVTCAKVFRKPISVITGGAGTGKTTVLEKLMKAMESASGDAESFCLLAPTGKAADRIRDKTGRTAITIHSFLTQRNWMRTNLTYRSEKGRKESDFTTYIIDETSMMDLALFAAFIRSVNWNKTKRLILVGDANQLPPIGRSKVFDDVIKHLKKDKPDSIGKLEHNLRQLLNQVNNSGNGIIRLASLYIQENLTGENASLAKAEAEKVIQEIQMDEFDKDVSFYFWNDKDDLDNKINRLIDELREQEISIDNSQILSPYRGEYFGTESINSIVQRHLNGYNLDKKGNLNGITLFDKVIQFRNRTGRDSYYSYDLKTRRNSRVEVYNGEIGRVFIHSYDKEKYKGYYYNLKSKNSNGFQVKFERKTNHLIDFSNDNAVAENIELAYAISVHKAQGSEFDHVILIIPKSKVTLLSPELLYTGLTRASKRLHIFLEEDYTTLLNMRRPEKSNLKRINSSTFEFNPLPLEWLYIENQDWFKEGRIHSTLTEYLVRSKSEVIIANLLQQEEIEFEYEKRLVAPDGSFYLPDFTLSIRGEEYYWEHLGLLENEDYNNHWKNKKAWYNKHFPEQLITTEDGGNLTKDAIAIINKILNRTTS
ncbi:AAA family ATPase [Flavobacterium sp.]|uniref:AAA family ATPase n=1 Tax=Flavobacterium sp. TaxID=239 RepID=UPI003919295D